MGQSLEAQHEACPVSLAKDTAQGAEQWGGSGTS